MIAVSMEWRRHPRLRHYEISEYGDVRRGSKRLRGYIDADGYVRYSHLLDVDGAERVFSAHRLVAETFIGDAPSSIHEVAHNNGSRLANHYTNLRWATRKENDDDTRVHGTTRSGVKNGRAKLSESDVTEIRLSYRKIKARELPFKVSDLAAVYGIHHATLINIATGKSWSHLPMPAEGA